MSVETIAAYRILAEVMKRVLKKDPFQSSIERTFDELRKENPDDWVVLEEIYNKRKEIFNNINIKDKATFKKILDDYGVKSETSSRLYNKLTKNFREIIDKAAKENQDIFRPYAIQELKMIGEDNKKIIKSIEKIIGKLELTHHLYTIAFELKKGIESEGKFFRKEGPLWIDFESDYVVKRHEVNKIIKCFKKGTPRILLVGEAASGKSVIARNVGFELANELDVFYINSKEFETHKVDAIFKDVQTLKKGSLIIIEDAHSYPEHCDDLMRDVHAKSMDIKMMFTARSTYNLHKHVPYLDSCKKFIIEAFDSADSIIKKYAEKTNFPQPSAKEIEELKNQSKESLWVLAYFLMAWEPRKPIEVNQVYEKVYNDLIGLDDKYGINGSHHVILALAPFYQYEILVEKPFLTEELELDNGTIKKLTNVGEIRESNGFLSLHHSALARIYIKTSERYADIVDSLLYKLKHFDKDFHERGDYIANMFRCYLRCKPKNYDKIFSHLRFEKHLVNNIFRDKNINNVLYDLLEKESDIDKIGYCVGNISSASSEVGKELVEVVKSKLEKESDIEKIRYCVRNISFVSREVGQALAESLDLNNLKSKIEKESDMEKIRYCVCDLSIVSSEVGKELVEVVKSKLEKESDIKKIGYCVRNISFMSREVGKAVGKVLAESLDLNNLKSKIEKESDIEKIGRCVRDLSTASTMVGKELVTVVKSKIEEGSDIEKIGYCIRDISFANNEVGKALVESLDLNNLKSIIKKESNIEKIGSSINKISFVSREIGKALTESLDLNNLKSIIEKESDMEKIGICVSDISLANGEVGKALRDMLKMKI